MDFLASINICSLITRSKATNFPYACDEILCQNIRRYVLLVHKVKLRPKITHELEATFTPQFGQFLLITSYIRVRIMFSGSVFTCIRIFWNFIFSVQLASEKHSTNIIHEQKIMMISREKVYLHFDCFFSHSSVT